MRRLIDEQELQKYIMHDGCEKGCGYIDERDLKYIQTVEAIPIPEAATNEDVLKAIFPDDAEDIIKYIKTAISNGWLNSNYKRKCELNE